MSGPKGQEGGGASVGVHLGGGVGCAFISNEPLGSSSENTLLNSINPPVVIFLFRPASTDFLTYT